jgi:hypothetical protein
MISRPMKVLVCALGVALLSIPAADAASKKKKAARATAPAAAMNTAEPCRGEHLFPCGPIYFTNKYLGEDPDPFIRSMINRDLGPVFGDPD